MNIKLTKNILFFKKDKYKVFKIENYEDYKVNFDLDFYDKNFIESFDQFNKLGINDFTSFNLKFIEKLLKKKCVAFIIFNKNKLVHIRWISLYLETHNIIDDIPFQKYLKNEKFGVWGNAYTDPNHRGLGFNKLSISKCMKYLKDKKIRFSFASVRSNNLVNINTYLKIKKYDIHHKLILRFLFFKVIF